MSFVKYLLLICLLASPQLLLAAEKNPHRYTPKEQIAFTSTTNAAFDHSGKLLSRSVHPDGSASVENNGSFGNVTVARRNPDGSIETFCTTDAALARSWMSGEGATRATVSLDPPVVKQQP